MLAFQSISTLLQPTSSTIISSAKYQLNTRPLKDYAVIVIIIVVHYLYCKLHIITKVSTSNINQSVKSGDNIEMGDRFNISPEVRELKLGATFSSQNPKTAFHTLKYDFKPASVDLSKVASLDVSSNNQVTVTVPNLESSGVPNTVFKGNQRKYAKEFVIIYDKVTGTTTIEKLSHNIQVKKTRSEPPNKAIVAPPPQRLENNTQRTSSKTRVSTGIRKNTIIGFVPRSSPMQQGSPSNTTVHKSPQSAPVWNANNAQSTLPSIPLILDEDTDRQPPSGVSMANNVPVQNNSDFQQPQMQQYHHNMNSIHPQNNNFSGSNGSMMMPTGSAGSNLAASASILENEIGELSTSDTSSDSESSGSGSESDNSADNSPQKLMQQQQSHQNHHQQPPLTQLYPNGSEILHDDLQLSESNSSDSDYD